MRFKIAITLPFDQIQYGEEFVSMAAVHECARAAEEAGFTSGTVTDHPIPSYRWLGNGGHYAQDPFVMLALVAASTSRLHLQTNILVLPYRNPFITARAVSSLDCFSGGRVVLGLGAGYLRPEYKALGVDFDTRNELMDEYINAMKAAWSGEDFAFEGTGYRAVGNRMRPTPTQTPHPPLLIGGNSKRAMRRAVELGQAWHPFLDSQVVTNTARTANLSSDQDLLDSMAYLRGHAEALGHAGPPPVICSATFNVDSSWSAQAAIDHFGHLRGLGIAGSGVTIAATTRSEWCDQVCRFGEEVIGRNAI